MYTLLHVMLSDTKNTLFIITFFMYYIVFELLFAQTKSTYMNIIEYIMFIHINY